MRLFGLLLLWLTAMAHVADAAAPDFAQPGPCSQRSWQTEFPTPAELRLSGMPKTLSANITLPILGTESLPFGSPFPVLLYYNGFMVGAAAGAVQHTADTPARAAANLRRRHRRRIPLAPPLPSRRTGPAGTGALCARWQAGA